MAVIEIVDCVLPGTRDFGGQIPAMVGKFYVNPFVERPGLRTIGNTLPAPWTFGFYRQFPVAAPIVTTGIQQRGWPVNLAASPVVDLPFDATKTRQTGFPRRTLRASGGAGRRGGSHITDGVVRSAACPLPDAGEVFWFDRLHILPTTAEQTNLGNVVNDVDTTFTVFNAHRTLAAVINALNQLNAAGFTFIAGRTPPSPELTIVAYGEESYTIRAEAEFGPPVIDATFTWIPNAPFESVDVNFIGNRITILAFEPQVGPQTEYEWLTSIVESYNGTEQRMQMRDRPRQSITYTYRKGDANVNLEEPYPEEPTAFEHVMFDSLGRVFALPVWEDRTVLRSPVAINDTTVNIDTSGLDLQVGQLILLWRDWNDTEAQEISAVGALTVTVSNPFLQAWAIEDTVVLPTFTAYADDNVVQAMGRLDTALWRIRFNRINERTDLIGGVSPELPADFEGIPIWPRKWGISGTTINRTWRRDIQPVNVQLGKIGRSFRKTTPRRLNSELRVEIRGRADFLAFRQFVLALKGKQKIFWLGSKYHQFRLQALTPAGGGSLRVFNNLYTNFVANRAQFDRINVVLTDGTETVHTILAAADVGTPPNNETDLTITPTAPVEYNTTNVERIEYYTRHRLDTDRVVFQATRPKDHYILTFPIIEVLNET